MEIVDKFKALNSTTNTLVIKYKNSEVVENKTALDYEIYNVIKKTAECTTKCVELQNNPAFF